MLPQVEELAALMNSPKLSETMKNRIIAALHYFIWAEDKFLDYLPIVGYLDDAFIISVVYKESKKCRFRERQNENNGGRSSNVL